MPKLGAKHSNQSSTTLGDFTGGLNTATSEEFIDDNQLSEVINMEADVISKKLYTVLGTKDLITTSEYGKIVRGFWDNINSKMLFFTNDGSILSCDSDLSNFVKVGTLDGTDYVDISCVCWEDGVLIANGGHIQYLTATKGLKLVESDGAWKYVSNNVYNDVEVIEDSPEHSYSVFVRSGRVVVHDDNDQLLYSGVGDETNWTQDQNDPSASLFAEIGYKAGGKIISVTPNSSDILILKDNGLCYRLSGEYPDWSISEVSRELYCNNVDGSCSLGNGTAMILGNGILNNVTVTQDYGDMRPSQMGQQVAMQIAALPSDTKLRYLASLNQVWFITKTQYVLVYDVGVQSFYQRWFNAPVNDVFCIDQKTYLVRDDRISTIDFNNGVCQDFGEPLIYQARLKTEVSTHDLLVKTEGICVTPMVKEYDSADVVFSIGRVDIPFPLRKGSERLVQTVGANQKAETISNINLDERYYAGKSIYKKTRKMFRGDRVRLSLSGKGFPFMLNFITYEKVEV